MYTQSQNESLLDSYRTIRQDTEHICAPLETEDYVVQPIEDVSPPKWHLGHTTWFFETFVLKNYVAGYREFDPEYSYVFNSYYETLGARVIRTDRGNLSRPTVKDVYRYRKYVDDAMISFLAADVDLGHAAETVLLGLNHEQQHQELLFTDIKYILGHNPLLPAYDKAYGIASPDAAKGFIPMKAGLYEIGFKGEGFSWDNESNRHQVYLNDFEISAGLVTNAEFLEFIESGGYQDFRHWHSDGWNWVKRNEAQAPLYWHKSDGAWQHFTLRGLEPLDGGEPVNHVNFYEAAAFAEWKGMRLPTEFEWEAAAHNFNWGARWEWTESAYLPYPGYKKAEGALGEYNGKFMINQQVLRGASEVTSRGHSRATYRNFFQPHHQWQYTGIRLAR